MKKLSLILCLSLLLFPALHVRAMYFDADRSDHSNADETRSNSQAGRVEVAQKEAEEGNSKYGSTTVSMPDDDSTALPLAPPAAAVGNDNFSHEPPSKYLSASGTYSDDKSEELSFSDEELDEVLEEATQAQEHWKAIHVDATTSPTAVQELLDQLERDEDLWERKQERLNFLAEQMEAPEKLQLVISACSETLNILREQEPQLLPKKRRSYRSDSLSTDEGQSDQTLATSIATLSLKSAAGSFLYDQSHFAELEQQAKSLREYAQQRGERAQQEHREARNSFVQRLLTQAEDYYQDAISSAKKAAAAWEKSERAHLELMQISGQKLRRWGARLKITWQERAKAWEKECSSMFESLQRQKKIEELQQRINEAIAKRNAVLEQRPVVDQEEEGEIGEVHGDIVKKLEVIQRHYENVQAAYAGDDEKKANDLLEKIKIIEGRIPSLNQHLQFLNSEKKKWDEYYRVDPSRRHFKVEGQRAPDGKKIDISIDKNQFNESPIRIEEVFDHSDKLISKNKMNAEHLMVKLKTGESKDHFLEQLRREISGSPCTLEMEDVIPEDALYCLRFQSLAHDHILEDQLQLFDKIKNHIGEKALVDHCYPDFFFELAGNGLSSSSSIEGPEPWGLHSRFGINFFESVFDDLVTPQPIRIAVIDTGIFISHEVFRENIHRWQDEAEEFDCYGYDATASTYSRREKQPNDKEGHGTLVAGIIAGMPSLSHVTQVHQQTAEDLLSITPSIIQGVVSHSGIVELLICKAGNARNECSIKNILKCIDYAHQQKAQIINCSWSLRPSDLDSGLSICREVVEHIKPYFEKSIEIGERKIQPLFVAAAGNLKQDESEEERDIDTYLSYPVRFDLSHLIGVAATGRDGQLMRQSKYGQEHVNVAAPGESIISASVNAKNAYKIDHGTSLSTPYVTGSIALMMAKFGWSTYHPEELINHLCSQASRTPPIDNVKSGGRLNLAGALTPPLPLPAAVSLPPAPAAASEEEVSSNF